MISNILLQSQKNEILLLIEEAGLKPSSFEWLQVESHYFTDSKISRLNYIDTDFFYAFDMNGETHYATFSPADNSYVGTGYPGIWSKQKDYFSDWLANLIKENNEPDLWKELSENASPTYRTQTYQATPSHRSPDHKTMSGRLDKLLEKNTTETKPNRPNTGFVIKRYYGKA